MKNQEIRMSILLVLSTLMIMMLLAIEPSRASVGWFVSLMGFGGIFAISAVSLIHQNK